MNKIFYIFLLLASLPLVACEKDESVSTERVGLGECVFHPSFLWSDEYWNYTDNHIVLDFNDEAINDKSEATLIFVDADKEPLDLSKYEIKIDGAFLVKPELTVNTLQKDIKLEIRSYPQEKSGIKAGYLILKDSKKLDRIGQTEIKDGQRNEEILQWHFRFNKHMNPLAKVVMWIGIVILSILLLWFLLIKPIKYKRFGTIVKTMSSINQPPLTLRFKGAREIIVDNKLHKQSIFDRVFKGHVVSKVYPSLTAPLMFKPKGRNCILIKANNSEYHITRNPISKTDSTEIIVIKTNNKISIN